ncbi:MAG: hypothetical protein IJJ01_12030 [Firmicutes bacterium]|nr:hypothetical protein [Bacillota bacterium]
MKKLTIDTEFYNLSVPNTAEQQAEFERSILYEGCLDPIITWEGIVIDGHKRYLICSLEEIEYKVQEVSFPSREKAMAWICRRRIQDLRPGTPIYKYLFGKMINCLKPSYREMIRNGSIGCYKDPDGRIRISKTMSDDLGVNYSMVESSSVYANNVDKIARDTPEIFHAMMEGKIKVTIREAGALARGERKIKRAVRSRMIPDEEIKPRRGRPRKMTEQDEGVMLSTKIKEMPDFDPDMEIRGLTLTIPTWMAAIARAEKKTDMKLATQRARRQLAESLLRLDEQIQITLEAIGCTEKEY